MSARCSISRAEDISSRLLSPRGTSVTKRRANRSIKSNGADRRDFGLWPRVERSDGDLASRTCPALAQDPAHRVFRIRIDVIWHAVPELVTNRIGEQLWSNVGVIVGSVIVKVVAVRIAVLRCGARSHKRAAGTRNDRSKQPQHVTLLVLC
jgi:hypothetical protein